MGAPGTSSRLGILAIVSVGLLLVSNPSEAQEPISLEPEVIDKKLLLTIEGGVPGPDAMQLSDVLRSIATHHPKIESARQKMHAMAAKRFSAQGVYDPTLSARGQALRGGYYETNVANAELRQYLGLWGTEVYGGYRIGLAESSNRYPSYEKTETLAHGEVRAGVTLPIWRDGPIDPRRAGLDIAEQLERAGGFEFREAELGVRLEAIATYYHWLAAGHQLDIADRLLTLARTRMKQVSAQRDAGSASDFEVTDSEQMVLSREAAVVSAEQKMRAMAVELSLYLRDKEGRPIVPRRSALPPFRSAPEKPVPLELTSLLECHPRLQALNARIVAAQRQADLAANQVAPEARALFEVSRDLGDVDDNVDLTGTNVRVGVELKVPLLLRQGRGASDAAEAELRSLESDADWIRDKVRATAQKVAIDQRAALRQTRVERDLVAATETLAEGERYRLNAGGSTMLVVNLREIAVAQAATKFVYALAELHTMRATIDELNRLQCD